MSFFQNILSSVMKNTRRLNRLGTKSFGKLHSDINKAVDSVMSTSGEVSSLVYAEHLLNLIEKQDDNGLKKFLKNLLAKYDIDTKKLLKDVKRYSSEKTEKSLREINNSSEPRWVELFRRLNSTSNGTSRLVKLRERIHLLKDPELKTFDSGLLNLFRYWFNPSFLVLEKIDWETPANILEKIIEYEAVHEINSWDDLRARLAPNDRQCFAFFHPLIPEDPLIFVEVALTNGIPESIESVIKIDRDEIEYNKINTAVFYSISNCQDGLAGISFGNFLIKKVAHKLKQEISEIDKFVTLSPVPGLMRWMENHAPVTYENCINKINDDENLLKKTFLYLTESNRDDNLPNDPVARFHLGNGAILHKINLHGDQSKKGMAQSHGVMINYLYDLDIVEKNHELFFKNKEVVLSGEMKSLKKKYS